MIDLLGQLRQLQASGVNNRRTKYQDKSFQAGRQAAEAARGGVPSPSSADWKPYWEHHAKVVQPRDVNPQEGNPGHLTGSYGPVPKASNATAYDHADPAIHPHIEEMERRFQAGEDGPTIRRSMLSKYGKNIMVGVEDALSKAAGAASPKGTTDQTTLPWSTHSALDRTGYAWHLHELRKIAKAEGHDTAVRFLDHALRGETHTEFGTDVYRGLHGALQRLSDPRAAEIHQAYAGPDGQGWFRMAEKHDRDRKVADWVASKAKGKGLDEVIGKVLQHVNGATDHGKAIIRQLAADHPDQDPHELLMSLRRLNDFAKDRANTRFQRKWKDDLGMLPKQWLARFQRRPDVKLTS